MRRRWWAAAAATLIASTLALAAAPAAAQSPASAVAAAGDAKVRFSFAARPSICGDGARVGGSRSTEDWEGSCDSGPVRVVLTVAGGEVREVRSYVGGRWRPASETVRDLGMIPAPAAAGYLLDLARRLEGRIAKKAIFPAAIAEGATVWPALLELARAADRPREVRRQAVFWLGQEAATAATQGLAELALDQGEDRAVREHAIFALSRRPRGEGIPALLRVARTSPDPALRRKAFFWLAESEDPRALALIEEVLTGH